MRCAVIARHRDEFPVRLMCRVLAVSVAGFYAYLKRPASWRAVIDEVLMAHVRIAFAESQFDVNGVALNRVWIGDITYIPTREGTLYLAAVLDLGSRRCIGWAMRDTMEVELVLSALRMAQDARRPEPGLIFHSDRGSQYASGDYRAELAAHGMVASMSGTGDCYDNAVAESFFATLEFELLMKSDWHTRSEARRAISRYIETWYNVKRRHSTLGYISPMTYEAQQQAAA